MNRQRNFAILWLGTAILVITAVVVITWQNYRYAQANKGGNDFLIQWMGARTFLIEGTSPYSDEAAARAQNFLYGREAQPGEQPLRYVYPLYAMAIYFPFALIPNYSLARALFMTVLELSLIFTIIFSIRLVRWRPGIAELAVFTLFGLFWFHAVRPLLDGNVAIIIALLITSALLALKNGGDGLAGLLLAFATIKPNLVVVFIAFILLWALINGRMQLVGWFFATLFLLVAVGLLLLPDWILQNLRELINYSSYSPPGTIGAILSAAFPAMADRIARIVYGVLAGMIIAEWWWARKAEFRGFLWAALFTLLVSQWVGITTAPQNFIVLLPALALVFSTWEGRWRRGGHVLSITSMILLFAGIWVLYLLTLDPQAPLVVNPLLFLPLPGFLIITMYWVRWWAIRPPSVWFDLLDHQETI